MIRYKICKRSGCGRKVLPENNPLELCPKCTEFVEMLVWALDNVKFKNPKETDSGLVIP
jgi:hypothetical protein